MNSPCVLDVGLGTVYPLSSLTHTFNQLYLHFTDKENLRLRRVTDANQRGSSPTPPLAQAASS